MIGLLGIVAALVLLMVLLMKFVLDLQHFHKKVGGLINVLIQILKMEGIMLVL